MAPLSSRDSAHSIRKAVDRQMTAKGHGVAGGCVGAFQFELIDQRLNHLVDLCSGAQNVQAHRNIHFAVCSTLHRYINCCDSTTARVHVCICACNRKCKHLHASMFSRTCHTGIHKCMHVCIVFTRTTPFFICRSVQGHACRHACIA